jgi:DNA-binding NarL/FixJ family response regulator
MTRVLIIEDHASLREPLRFMFEREPEFEVVGEAESLSEARKILGGIDVAIVDLALPDGDGTDLIPELRATSPRAVVLVLTASVDQEEYARAIEAGAAGVLHKSARIKEVIGAVRRLMSGEALLSPNQIAELLSLARRQREQTHAPQRPAVQLTRREQDILQALAEGLNDKEIADRLHITAGTARNHTVNVLGKLNAHSRLQALVFAVRQGLVEIY